MKCMSMMTVIGDLVKTPKMLYIFLGQGAPYSSFKIINRNAKPGDRCPVPVTFMQPGMRKTAITSAWHAANAFSGANIVSPWLAVNKYP